MKNLTKTLIATIAAATASTAAIAGDFGLPISKENVDVMVRTAPATIKADSDEASDLWFDYQTDISEARYEYREDLERATDLEDRQDALLEYRTEVIDAEKDYVKELRELGYKVPSVTLIGDA